MKKLLNYAWALAMTTTANFAQNLEVQNDRKINLSQVTEEIKDLKTLSKTEFNLKGEYDSQIKLEFNLKKDIELYITVFDIENNALLIKLINKKGWHQIYFDCEEDQMYRVVIESEENVDFLLKKLNLNV